MEISWNTERLILRDVLEADTKKLIEIFNKSKNSKYLEASYRDTSHMSERIKKWIKLNDTIPRTFFKKTLIDKQSKLVIGEASFAINDKKVGLCTIGWTMDCDYWGKGLATELGTSFIKIAKDIFKCHRVWAESDVNNIASRRVLEKIGMTHEGTLRKNYRLLSGWSDTAIYGLVFDELVET